MAKAARKRVATRLARSRDASGHRYTDGVSIGLSRLPMLSLSLDDDRRFWHPDPERGAVEIGGRWARVVVHSRPVVARSRALSAWGLSDRGLPVGLQVPVGLRFESPFRVLTCLRRKIRRQVIFARRKAGKGVRRRRPRRTWRSQVVC